MRKSMREIWFSLPDDLEPRTDCEPIDWLPFKEVRFPDDQNEEILIRAARNTNRDLAGAAQVFQTGFPVIRGSEFEILFQPEGFPLLLGADQAFNKGDKFMLVAEHVPSGRIVAAEILSMWKKQRNVEILVITVHEDFQERGIARKLQEVCDEYFEECGVEMVFVWAAAEHNVTQRLFLERGFTIRAVIPGFYRIWAGGNKYRRTIEVFAQKFYGGADKMSTRHLELVPEAEDLIIPWWGQEK
jgi:ribosomal protein S18 acetylase RimI-like enzyme